jgi:phosphatidylethanolamine/phosphatidyl-N-methylethanolamine N-methyltransferase
MAIMREQLRFAGQMLRHPRSVGAVAPSSKRLARVMVAALGKLEPGSVILELGPGTGAFTRQLCQDRPGNKILAIERSPSFVRTLQQAGLRAEIIEGCATKLADHLRRHAPEAPVAGVLSGLPLLNLPDPVRDEIFDAIREVLRPGQPYVQFTYSRKSWNKFMPHGFELSEQHRVWRNIPPAMALVFSRKED